MTAVVYENRGTRGHNRHRTGHQRYMGFTDKYHRLCRHKDGGWQVTRAGMKRGYLLVMRGVEMIRPIRWSWRWLRRIVVDLVKRKVFVGSKHYTWRLRGGWRRVNGWLGH